MITRRAFRSIVRNKLAKLLAWKILTKTTMLNILFQTTFDKLTVHMKRRNAATAFIRIVWTFAAKISTESSFWITHGLPSHIRILTKADYHASSIYPLSTKKPKG
jgi:hypothetical protein